MAVANHTNGVAIVGLGNGVRANIATGSRLVLHHHRLAQRAGQGLGQQARLHIGRRARRVADDDAQGLGGPSINRLPVNPVALVQRSGWLASEVAVEVEARVVGRFWCTR